MVDTFIKYGRACNKEFLLDGTTAEDQLLTSSAILVYDLLENEYTRPCPGVVRPSSQPESFLMLR